MRQLEISVGTLLSITLSFVWCGQVFSQEPLPQLNAKKQHVPQETKEKAIVVRAYSVGAITQKAERELGLSAQAASVWIVEQARKLLRLGDAADHEGVIGLDDDSGVAKSVAIDASGEFTHLDGASLIVATTSEQHQKLTELLETLRQFSIQQLDIRVRVYRAPGTAALPGNWSFVESISTLAHQIEPVASSVQVQRLDPAVTVASAERKAASAERNAASAERNAHEQPQVVPLSLLPPVYSQGSMSEAVSASNMSASQPDDRQLEFAQAQSITERSTPVLYTLLEPTEKQRFLAKLQGSEGCEQVMVRHVAVFNQQRVELKDLQERPFVTSIRPLKMGPKGKQQIQFQPVVRVCTEGTDIVLQPRLRGQTVDLSCRWVQSSLAGVDTFELPGVAAQQTFKVQLPQVSSTSFDGRMQMPLGLTLAVQMIEKDTENRRVSTVMVCEIQAKQLLK